MKVAFLFGAGAEGSNLYNMPSGVEYLNDTILKDVIADESAKFRNTLGLSLDDEFRSKKYNEQEQRYKYRKDYLHGDSILESLFVDTAYSLAVKDINFAYEYKEMLYEILDKSKISEINEIHNIKYTEKMIGSSSKSVSNNEYFLQFKELVKQYGRPIERKLTPLQQYYFDVENELKFSDEVVMSGGFLDEKFHTIISPTKYGTGKFSKVFNYYWACYYCIINAIKKNYGFLVPDTVMQNDSVKSALALASVLYNDDFNKKIDEYVGDTYYKLLEANVLNEMGIECTGVITTNYTPFAKRMNVPENKIAYVNGQLKLFEIPGKLDVVDVTKTDLSEEKYLYFPFIFGQSKIKPIVHPMQMDEYRKMTEILVSDSTEILVSIGYGLNPDDNHINAYIRQFLMLNEKNRFIVVSDNKEKTIQLNLKLDHMKQVSLIDIKREGIYKNVSEIVDDIITVIKNEK